MIEFIVLVFALACVIWVAALLISLGLAMLVLSNRVTKWIRKCITIKINDGGRYYEEG